MSYEVPECPKLFQCFDFLYQFSCIKAGFSCCLKSPRLGHGAIDFLNPGMYTPSRINTQKPAGIPQDAQVASSAYVQLQA